MRFITLPAHFDGDRILLDEPFELKRNTPLMVTVLGTEGGEDDAWRDLAASTLASAYGNDEPEYTLDDVNR